jgi:hypothetical protein
MLQEKNTRTTGKFKFAKNASGKLVYPRGASTTLWCSNVPYVSYYNSLNGSYRGILDQ